MKLKRPTKTDFSDTRLTGCFSIAFINKLKRLSDKKEDFLILLGNFLESIDDNLFKKNELKIIENNFRNRLGFNQSVLLLDNSNKGQELFFKKYNLKRECLICKNKRIQYCHLLKRSFFKNQKRLRSHYKLFRNHFSNLVPLCPNHHDLLDKTNSLPQCKINKIISYNKKVVSKMNRNMDRELRNLEKCEKLFREMNNKIYNSISREINVTLGKI